MNKSLRLSAIFMSSVLAIAIAVPTVAFADGISGYTSDWGGTGYTSDWGTGYSSDWGTGYSSDWGTGYSSDWGTGYTSDWGTGYTSDWGTGYSSDWGTGYSSDWGTGYSSDWGTGYTSDWGTGYTSDWGTGYTSDWNYTGGAADVVTTTIEPGATYYTTTSYVPTTYYSGSTYYDTYNSSCGYYYSCGSSNSNYNSNYNYNYNYNYNHQETDYCSNIAGVQGKGYDCYPETDYCPNIPGMQGKGYDCYPKQHDYEPVCALSASDTSIKKGQSTTLHWTSEHANFATLTGFGTVQTGGSRSVNPSHDETFTLTVRDNDGDIDTCSVHINVEEDDRDDDEPWCELEVSDSRVEEGDRVTLSWDTRNASYASINQGIGRVDEDGGSERVEVDGDTTFRLTVRDNDGDEDDCSVSVRVDEERDLSSVTFYGDSVNNPPTVYLSELPYTGLEDLTPEMMAYWLLVIAGVGVAGYYFVTRNLPIFAYASVTPEVETNEGTDAAEVSPSNSFVDALRDGATDAAVDELRNAAIAGTDVESFLEEARASVSDDDALAGRLDAAIAASRLTGVRGAKDALSA